MATTSKIEPLKKPITPKTSQLLGSNDSEQLSVLRSDALDLSGKLQMPSSQDERPWKYLDISQLDVEDYPIVVSDENQKINISERYFRYFHISHIIISALGIRIH